LYLHLSLETSRQGNGKRASIVPACVTYPLRLFELAALLLGNVPQIVLALLQIVAELFNLLLLLCDL
jgi:hypothetical protein